MEIYDSDDHYDQSLDKRLTNMLDQNPASLGSFLALLAEKVGLTSEELTLCDVLDYDEVVRRP